MDSFRHALIMAAGRGVRMRPLTDAIPKPMAPFGDSTLILTGIRRVRKTISNLHITVGYKASMLAEHIMEEGVASLFYTGGKGNAWWLFNTLVANLDEPLVVLTCDNLVELDLSALWADYHSLGAPAAMVVPVCPVPGLEGDFIFHEDQVVQALDRSRASSWYCSGIQVLHPKRIRDSLTAVEDFRDVWAQLIERRQLYCSRVIPRDWFTIDTIGALERATSNQNR